ncbi:aldehyde dehydrogenase family protein [bacterium]|nr:aldehyde dehydrogenase family protein [bacterium]
MSDFTMTIGGRAVPAVDTFEVINPATGAPFTTAPECTKGQLDAAMQAAAEAYRAWRRDEDARRAALQRCAAVITERAGELAPILTREQGKPLPQAFAEIMGAAMWFTYTATLQLPVEVLQDDAAARVEVRRRPLGVVAAITPWNFPLILATWKLAPALLAGNTVVLKPSPFTPLTTLKLGELLRDVVPAGVVNVVSGGNDLGGWMTTHPVPRKISFTGSVATGKKVAAAAAPDLKRVTLELGGNDPAIVLPDANPKEIASKLFWGAFQNCGQVCSAIKRVYAPAAMYDALVGELAAIARGVIVGDGLADDSQLGPLNNRPQFERVQELVEDARKHGARIAAGGEPLGGNGYFYRPTVVAEVSDGVRLVDEEQFGPALPVIAYQRVEDAIERANATHFGLGGSVWSRDTERAVEVAKELECGTAWVNQHLELSPATPFGGAKWSGIGVENGPWGLYGFTELQTVNVARG